MKYYEVTEELLNNVLEYLGTKPSNETYHLISKIHSTANFVREEASEEEEGVNVMVEEDSSEEEGVA